MIEVRLLFNSFGYLLLFLPLVLAAVSLLSRYVGARSAQLGVLLASVAFYGWYRPWNLPYLAGSVLVNWLVARQVQQSPAKKQWLQFGLILNVSYLCVFKYVNFLLRALPFTPQGWQLIPDLELPLGISFFTLTQVMYLVDCYEGIVAAGTLFDHATFVCFFPNVLSGPLARAKRMRHQFQNFGRTDEQHLARGLFLFSMGLFKKTVCAETFGQVANYGFDTARHRSALEVLVFTTTYSLQLYFDFSGYSDMAIGTAEMLGIEIPRNFDVPFRSKSIIEFWTRWHISLSSFITTYLYTPILRAMPRVSLSAGMLSTLIAMTIAGLWHGPSWTFVLFGILHGVALALNAWWRKRGLFRFPWLLSWLLTFCFVDVAFLFFRAPTLAVAGGMLREAFTTHPAYSCANLLSMRQTVPLPIFGPPLLFGLVAAFYGKSSEQLAREFKPRWQSAIISGLALTVAAIYMNSQIAATFIYFKF